MKKYNKKYAISTLFFFVFFFVIYVFSAYSLFGLDRNTKAEWWVNDAYKYKKYIAERILQKKVIVAGGSNVLFGIDSETLSETVGFPVLNLATHGAHDIRFYEYQIEKHTKEGDIVVLPLEFEFYERTTKFSNWQANNYLSWGKDFFIWMPIVSKFQFIHALDPKMVFTGLSSKLFGGDDSILVDESTIVDRITELNNTEGEKWRDYSYESLTIYGDMNVGERVMNSRFQNENTLHYKIIESPTADFISSVLRIKRTIEDKNATFVLTWPATIKNAAFNFENRLINKKILSLKDSLTSNGINMSCHPASFNFKFSYFFDSVYHLNNMGSQVRSINLANCIKNEILNKAPPIDFSEAYALSEIIQRDYPPVSPLSFFKRRLSDLESIKSSLEKFYLLNKKYPKSKNWDGIYSLYGESGQNYIKGLAPKFISKLPIDPRKSTSGSENYLYKSNGKDFKIIAHDVREDILFIGDDYPSIIDPIRKGWAFGFWTEGAKNW